MSTMDVPTCPGFCGRIPENNSLGWSECAPCPWGTRTFLGQCVECDTPLPAYDYCYLLFMAIVPLLINCFYINLYTPKKSMYTRERFEYLSCFAESVSASLVALMCFPPRFFLTLDSCRKAGIKEWYPALYNPVLGYVKQLKCSYEIVFPLYSLPFFYLLFLLLFMVVYRILTYMYLMRNIHNVHTLYYSLLAIPKVAIIHGLFAGILYHTFPYLLIVFSISSNAFHLAMEGKAPIREIIRRLANSPTQLVLLCINMALLAFSIIALTAGSGSLYGLFFLLLVPIPAIFYIITIGWTHPSVLNDV